MTDDTRTDLGGHNTLVSVGDLAGKGELLGQRGLNDGIYGMADGVTLNEFDAAIEAAKAEGNVSRANVVRKINCTPGAIEEELPTLVGSSWTDVRSSLKAEEPADGRENGRWKYGKSQNSDLSKETRRVLGIIADHLPDALADVRDDLVTLNAAYESACGLRDKQLARENEERQLAVKVMSSWGLSTRAIAPVVGVSQPTVVKDIAETGDNPVITSPTSVPATAPSPTSACDTRGSGV